jgi:Amt family ammonium transporter
MDIITTDTLWVIIATILVMLMQAGFSLVEVGYTRAKNAVNIVMKNFVDFSVGSLIFWFVGFGLMFGTDISSLLGTPDFFFTHSYGHLGLSISDSTMLIFQTVFAATAATIVSGAIAERTKFSTYIIITVVITAVIYPISGHWVWGGGWLSTLETPFHDFAGSSVVHSVGAWVALAGAIIVGPRIGKYGKQVNAIPGHNLMYGGLGVLILWFGWFGFNGGSQLAATGSDNALAISTILINTNLSASAGALSVLFLTWFKYGKPGLSLTLNGALGGLVAVTAGCDIFTPLGSVITGALAGIILVYAVDFIDKKLKIDDPVGAISVHGVCGAFGTLMVGLLASEGGLFYGGGGALLMTQFIGVMSIGAWAFSTGYLLFTVLKKTMGVRVSAEEEKAGLDISEHGESIYN